jgi:hypothetical protein
MKMEKYKKEKYKKRGIKKNGRTRILLKNIQTS